MKDRSAAHERADGRSGDVRPGAVRRSVGPGSVDSGVLAMSALRHVGYADHFVLGHVTDRRSDPERWARMMFGDTPDLLERLLWSGILGLRIQRGRSAGTIAGWRIADRGHDWISLRAASRSICVVLVVRITDETVELATVVRYDRSRGRTVWLPVAFVHRRLAPMLLRSTARGMARNLPASMG